MNQQCLCGKGQALHSSTHDGNAGTPAHAWRECAATCSLLTSLAFVPPLPCADVGVRHDWRAGERRGAAGHVARLRRPGHPLVTAQQRASCFRSAALRPLPRRGIAPSSLFPSARRCRACYNRLPSCHTDHYCLLSSALVNSAGWGSCRRARTHERLHGWAEGSGAAAGNSRTRGHSLPRRPAGPLYW